MGQIVALQAMRTQLHLSSSQLTQYLLCGRKYQYSYVQGLTPTHTSINLLLGSAIHTALEHYYRNWMTAGEPLPLPELQRCFVEALALSLGQCSAPVRYRKECSDIDQVAALGKAMLAVFHEQVDLTGMTIEAVELPLSVPLRDEAGYERGYNLVGVVDLLLRDEQTGELIAIDHKTSRNSYSQAMCDDSLQMTVYALLLQQQGYLNLGAGEIFNGRFQVLRKLKSPKYEEVTLTRDRADVQRLEQLCLDVLHAIDQRVFLPNYGWVCSDCGYRALCRGEGLTGLSLDSN